MIRIYYTVMLIFINIFYLYSQHNINKNDTIEVFYSTGKYGLLFRNFAFQLTPQNTLLPNNPVITKYFGLTRNSENYRYEILDEKSINFKENGQFVIYIPVEYFPFISDKNFRYIELVMPQTLDWSNPKRKSYIKQKQALYTEILNMVKARKGSVKVVLEFPHANTDTFGRKFYFRAAKGKYIDYTGQY